MYGAQLPGGNIGSEPTVEWDGDPNELEIRVEQPLGLAERKGDGVIVFTL